MRRVLLLAFAIAVAVPFPACGETADDGSKVTGDASAADGATSETSAANADAGLDGSVPPITLDCRDAGGPVRSDGGTCDWSRVRVHAGLEGERCVDPDAGCGALQVTLPATVDASALGGDFECTPVSQSNELVCELTPDGGRATLQTLADRVCAILSQFPDAVVGCVQFGS